MKGIALSGLMIGAAAIAVVAFVIWPADRSDDAREDSAKLASTDAVTSFDAMQDPVDFEELQVVHNDSNADDFVRLSIEGYQAWTLTNPDPFKTDPDPSPYLCRATPEEQVEFEFRTNPHFGRLDQPELAHEEHPFATHSAYLKVFVNELGVDAVLSDPAGDCPEGTIIIKEKWMDPENDDAPKLMTVMRKREAGYNSDCGDWEFAQFDGDGATVIAQGRLESCIRCHINRADTGYLFRDYIPMMNLESGLGVIKQR